MNELVSSWSQCLGTQKQVSVKKPIETLKAGRVVHVPGWSLVVNTGKLRDHHRLSVLSVMVQIILEHGSIVDEDVYGNDVGLVLNCIQKWLHLGFDGLLGTRRRDQFGSCTAMRSDQQIPSNGSDEGIDYTRTSFPLEVAFLEPSHVVSGRNR